MTKRFNPFPKANCQYGSPMGRQGLKTLDCTDPSKLCVSLPQGEYDSGGAYWGLGMSHGPVYAVWVRGKGHDGVCYVRARNKAKAIALSNPTTKVNTQQKDN